MPAQKSPSNDAAPDELMGSAMVRALLRELLSKLTALATDGSTEHMDLRRLPLPPGALDALKRWLGRGEIDATVTALGITTIQETGIAGVWWVRHAKSSGDTIAEHLEITLFPALLMAHSDDVYRAAETLRSRLATLEATAVNSSPSADPR